MHNRCYKYVIKHKIPNLWYKHNLNIKVSLLIFIFNYLLYYQYVEILN